MDLEDKARLVAEALAKSDYTIVLTGAGISADSGVPTFRGRDGLWRRYRPEELATPEAFARDPVTVWEWYKWRMEIIHRAKPNDAHYTIAWLEEKGLVKAVITQNVDGLHQRAGSRNVIELHGNIWRVLCTSCSYTGTLDKPPESVPPRCPKCGGLLRPGVVWFGESLPADAVRRAMEEALRARLILVVGTSGVVEPAGSIPLIVAENGGRIVNVNPEPNRYTGLAWINVEARAAPFFSVLRRMVEELL